MRKFTYPSVMAIAGMDGSGGAGIQADIKTISALGCYATSVLTALPVQNTIGVKSIHPIPNSVVCEQIETVFEDIPPLAIKIGMVHTNELVDIIADFFSKKPKIPIVFDPVMVAASGDKLIEDKTISSIIDQLFPIATLITPNMDEATILAEMDILTLDDMYKAGNKIMKMGCKSVLLKGGHLQTPNITSLYFNDKEVIEFTTIKIDTQNTHGSGCTLSSAIASYIAQGKTLSNAVDKGQSYVYKAIENSKNVIIGKGNGPLNHFFNPLKLIKNELV